MEMKKYTRKCFLSLSQSKTCTDPEGVKGFGPPHFPRVWILQWLNFVGHILAQDLQLQNCGRPIAIVVNMHKPFVTMAWDIAGLSMYQFSHQDNMSV